MSASERILLQSAIAAADTGGASSCAARAGTTLSRRTRYAQQGAGRSVRLQIQVAVEERLRPTETILRRPWKISNGVPLDNS